MPNPIISNMRPSFRLHKENELQFLQIHHFIYLENSIYHLKDILLYFVILLYSLKSVMKIILFCSLQPEYSWIPTFSYCPMVDSELKGEELGWICGSIWVVGMQLVGFSCSQPAQLVGGKMHFHSNCSKSPTNSEWKIILFW